MEEIDQEQKQIDAFFSKMKTDSIYKNALFLETNGMKYIRLQAGDTTKNFEEGEVIEFQYYGKTLSDTSAFDTNSRDFAIQNKMDTSFLNFDTRKMTVGQSNLIEGLQRGLKMSHPGEHAIFIFSSDLGFGKQTHGIVPGESPLLFEVSIY